MFEQASLKLSWAKSMTMELGRLTSEVLSKHPHKLVCEHDAETRGLQITVIGPQAPIPPEIALLAGDIATNIRASLDYAVAEMLNAKSGSDTRRHFPIHEHFDNLSKSDDIGKIRRFNPKVCDVILDEIKPTKVGNFSLWAVNRLSNKNKHRNLLLANHIQGIQFGAIKADDWEMAGFYFAASDPGGHPQQYTFPKIKDYADPQAISEICFTEAELRRPEVLDSLEIVKTLTNFAQSTEEAIKAIVRALD